jgi:hypothetical protein
MKQRIHESFAFGLSSSESEAAFDLRATIADSGVCGV